MARCRRAITVLVCLATAVLPNRGEEPIPRSPLPGESTSTARRLQAADRLAIDKQFAEAAEEYARILEEAGSDLVPVTDRLSVRARWLCHQRLAALPLPALRTYHNRVDSQARKWVDAGAAARDVRLLRRAVEEAFCSRATETALDLLGDLAFERGDFADAERWWRLLARPASTEAQPRLAPWARPAGEADLDLVYPDPQGDVARFRAKQLLARLFAGRTDEAAKELAAFRGLHPRAGGSLAGREGNYAEAVQALVNRPPQVAVEPADEWPTFAGAPSRQRLLPAEPQDPNRLLRLARDGPAWRFRLNPQGPPPAVAPRITPPSFLPATERARSLAFHPVIVGNSVVVGDARSVTAYDVTTGHAVSWDLFRDGQVRLDPKGGLNLVSTLPAPADLRYTLTAANGRLFARFGVQGLSAERKEAAADSYLACLELPEPGGEWRLVWLLKAQTEAGPPQRVFEGAPAVHDGLLHVAVTRFAGNQTVTSIECHAADREEPGLRWSTDVSTGRESNPRESRYRHHLLTVDGSHVIFCAQNGSIVALDSYTGRRAWAVRYPSGVLGRPGGPGLPRDLAPALAVDGRVYVAPTDYDGLLCLDSMTGQILWERPAVEVLHVLGVVGGRLIFSTRTGLRALRADDGSDLGGWMRPDLVVNEVGLPSWGRGFLAGNFVYWPTTDGVKVLRQEDGAEPENLIRLQPDVLPPGNLAAVEGCLAVCTAQELFVYIAPNRQAQPRMGAAPVRKGSEPRPSRWALASRGRHNTPEERTLVADLPASPLLPDPIPPLVRAWESRAPEEQFLPLMQGQPGRDALCVRGNTLVCRDALTGQVRWESPLEEKPTWVGGFAESYLVGGPGRVAAYAQRDGRRLWDWQATESALLGEAHLSDFQIAGPRLFCLQGEARLFALEATSGRALWWAWAPSARLSASLPDAVFSPHYLAFAERVLLQAPGRVRVLEALSGRHLFDAPAHLQPWREPPVVFEGQGVCHAPDPRQVVRLDLTVGKSIWSRPLERPISLTGEAPHLVAAGNSVLVLLPRNHTTGLLRLNAGTGIPLWTEEISLGPQRVAPESIAVDGETFFCALEGTLVARALADGRELWRRPLPATGSPWRLLRWPSSLVAFPKAASRVEFHSRWLAVSLELGVTFPPEDRTGYGIPVLFLDPRTGDPVQRLNLLPPRPRLECDLTASTELAGMPSGRFRRHTDPAGGLALQVTPRGAIFSWEGKAWAVKVIGERGALAP